MERVLFVDDDPLVLRAVRRTMGDLYDITLASSAQEALAELRRACERGASFCVIVSDLSMPGGNGDELLRAARSLMPGAVQILLTGSLDVRRRVADEDKAAIFAILKKPCAGEQLRTSIALAALEATRRSAGRDVVCARPADEGSASSCGTS
jgi:two-component system response regulator PhcR